jgi:hypothetical protein
MVGARLALLSQISSKSPIGASFMAKLEDPVAVEGKPVLPKGTIKRPDGTVQRARFELSSTESDSAKTAREPSIPP